MNLRLLCASVVLAGPVLGQTPCPSSGPRSKCGIGPFNNTFGGVVEFAGFRGPQGTHAGDALWKVYPKELFQRARKDTNFVSGVTIPWCVHNFATGKSHGLDRYELRHAVHDGNGHLVPDFGKPPLHSQSFTTWTFPRGAQHGERWFIRPLLQHTYLRVDDVDLAIVLFAEPGVKHTDPDVYTAFHSAGERYHRAPQPSFSGRVVGATGRIELLRPPVVTEATELQMELCFHESIARVSATSSKLGTLIPCEIASGVGAFYNDLASSGGMLRWYFEMPGFTPEQGLVIPILAHERSSTPRFLPGCPCAVDFDLGDPLTFALFALSGPVRSTRRWEWTEFDNNLAATPWLQVPAGLLPRGTTLHAGAVVLGTDLRVIRITNLVPTVLD